MNLHNYYPKPIIGSFGPLGIGSHLELHGLTHASTNVAFNVCFWFGAVESNSECHRDRMCPSVLGLCQGTPYEKRHSLAPSKHPGSKAEPVALEKEAATVSTAFTFNSA